MFMEKLVQELVKSGVLRTPEIITAFNAVDRANFVLQEYSAEAYEDYPLPIYDGQTISQPTTVAFMLELLAPQRGEKILDVGSGSGWTTALLAHIVGPSGSVIGVERIPELVRFGQENILKYDLPQARILPASNLLGLPKEAPFDRILVSAAGEALPHELVAQLKDGGIMVIPILDAVWHIIKKESGETETTRYPGFAFVPLIR